MKRQVARHRCGVETVAAASCAIARMRQTKALSRMKFLIMPRLSISSVTAAEWKTILALGK